MKKITESFIFNQLMKNQAVKDSVKNINIQRDTVSTESISEQIAVITKKMKYAGKDKTIELLMRGVITPIYNPTLSLPKYLFSMLKNDSGTIKAICDLTNFSSMNANGLNDIYTKTLFALMQSSAINYELFTNWNKYITNINLIKSCAITYSKMTGKILDRLYAIKIDQFKSDLIHFLLAKFFIINMCGRLNTANTDEIAYYACYNKSTKELIIDEASSLDDGMFNSFDAFIKEISKLGMKNLNVRIFIENFARMYGEASLLGIDYLPAFLSIIFGTAINANLGKDSIIETIAEDHVQTAYAEFFRLAR